MPEPIDLIEESTQDLDELNECEEEIVPEEIEDLDKNTPSYRCLVVPEISRSSILFDKYYYFPEIEDPELEIALWAKDPFPAYDLIGITKYKELCKTEGIIPFRKVINSLASDIMDLRFYGLRNSEMKTICGVLESNIYITTLLLEENYLPPESLEYLAVVLETNTNITTLNMKQCKIGIAGAEMLGDVFMRNSSIEYLDLSYNLLRDEGFLHIVNGIRFNNSIIKLNLSNNELADDAFASFRSLLEDNFTIEDLDVSWNYLYKAKGMKELMEGLEQNSKLQSLNLAWNGIGDIETIRGIRKYLRKDVKLKHLDLSNNRITGLSIVMLYAGMKANKSVQTLTIKNNPLTPYEIEDFARLLLIPNSPLEVIDFGDCWVKKSFIQIRTKINRLNKKVSVGGIFSNYKILGPNVQEVLLKRARYVGLKPKKKKLKKDYGEWLLSLEENELEKDKLKNYIKKGKIKLDPDLIKLLGDKFEKKNIVNLAKMKEVYLRLYPDTKALEKKVKKKKRGKKGGKKGKGKKK